MSLWESLICVGMSIGVLAGFRAWLPSQGASRKFMSDNAFAVYVVHPPILVALASRLRLSRSRPSPSSRCSGPWAPCSLSASPRRWRAGSR